MYSSDGLKFDLTAFVLLFPPAAGDPRWFALPWFWMPEENIEKRVKNDRVPYDVWIREGWIEATEGDVVDYDAVRNRILALRNHYPIAEVAIDPWNSTETDSKLQAEGLTVVNVRQGPPSMAAPTKALKTYVHQKVLAHLGNPVLRWQAANVVVRTDANGNETPHKWKSPERIDGIVALIMALSRALPASPKLPSIYETQGIATI